MSAVTAGWNDQRACFVSLATTPSPAIQALLDAIDVRLDALEAASGTPKTYACPALAVRGQIVYETASDTDVALANATNGSKAPAIGVIATKPTPTTCTIQQVGTMDGLVGLPADQSELFLDTTDGGFTATAPTGTGKIVQPLGIVIGPGSVDWHIDPSNYTTRA